jgi:hypothetical protein
MGNQGPINGVSMGWVPQTVHGFFAAEKIAVSGRGIRGSSGDSKQSRPAFFGLTDENMDRYESLGLNAPVFSVLTASGIVRMIRLRAYASPQSCVVKVPAAHTSGVISVTCFIQRNAFDNLYHTNIRAPRTCFCHLREVN